MPVGNVSVVPMPEEAQGLLPRMSGTSFLTASDAVVVLQSLTGFSSLTALQEKLCDANGSGSITAADAAVILQHVVGTFTAPSCIGAWAVQPAGALPPMATPTPARDETCSQVLQVSLADATSDVTGIDFVAGIVGDCNGSFSPPASAMVARGKPMNAGTSLAQIRVGRPARRRNGWRVPIAINSATPWTAATLHLRLDSQRLGRPRVSWSRQSQGSLAAYRVDSGSLALALARTEARSGHEVLAWLVFDGTASPRERSIRIENAIIE